MPSAVLATAITVLSSSLELDYVALSGGEPLLYRDLPTLVELAATLGVPSVLTTNGRAVTRQRLTTLADLGLNATQVPVLSHRPQVHDELAGRTSWDNAVNALSLSKELGLHASLVTVLTAINISHFRQVLRIAELIACDRVIVNRFHAAGQGLDHVDQLALSTEEFTAGTRELVRVPRSSLEIVYGTGESPNPVKPGRDHISRITVSPFGDVKFCNQETSSFTTLTADTVSRKCAELARRLNQPDHEPLVAGIRGCECRKTPATAGLKSETSK